MCRLFHPLMFLMVCLLISPVVVPASSGDDWGGKESLVEIRLGDFEEEFPAFYGGDYDVAGWDKSRSVVGLVVNYQGYQTLLHQGYEAEVIADSSPSRFDPEYVDYEEIIAWMEGLETAYPAIAKVVNLNDELSTPLTCESRALWAMKISDNVAVNEDEPAFVMDGTHHARELVTPLAILDVAQQLTQSYGVDPQITSWVDNYEVWLVPAVNPDGLEYVFNEYSMWRKNRKYHVSGEYGVDNNRNYSFLWGACGSTSTSPSSETFMGTAPESEEENQTMEALFAREKPVAYISYHSYGNEVLYPYVCATLAETDLYYGIRDQYASAMGYGTRYASASGESFEDCYNEHGAISFLTEIGTDFQPPFSQVPAILSTLRPGWQYLLERGMGAALTGHVTDTATGEPMPQATIRVEEIEYQEGERRNPEPLYGLFNRLLLPGVYTVTVSAFGYQSQTVDNVAITSGAPTSLDFALGEAVAGSIEGTVRDMSEQALVGVKVEALGTPLDPVYTDGTGFFTLDLPGGNSYDFRFTLTGYQGVTEEVFVPEGGTVVHDVILPDIPAILIWEPDETPVSGAAAQTALSALGWDSVLVTDLFEYGADLSGFQAVFVLVGIYPDNYTFSSGSPQEAALVSYLDNGGNLYMEGGDIWCYDSNPATLKGYFNFIDEGDGGSDLSTVLGVAGTFTAEMEFSYTGENSYMDHLGAASPAYEVFTNPSDGYGHGVAHDAGDYRTLAASFEFGGLVNGSSPSTREELMEAYLDFFGLGDPTPETIQVGLSCLPVSGTLAFPVTLTVDVLNMYSGFSRRMALQLDLLTAGGFHLPGFKSGHLDLNPGASFNASINQMLPAHPLLVGTNTFSLIGEDVTPAPYNQPPYPPSGDTDTDNCTVVGVAP